MMNNRLPASWPLGLLLLAAFPVSILISFRKKIIRWKQKDSLRICEFPDSHPREWLEILPKHFQRKDRLSQVKFWVGAKEEVGFQA